MLRRGELKENLQSQPLDLLQRQEKRKKSTAAAAALLLLLRSASWLGAGERVCCNVFAATFLCLFRRIDNKQKFKFKSKRKKKRGDDRRARSSGGNRVEAGKPETLTNPKKP